MAAKRRNQVANRAYGFHAVEAVVARRPEQVIEVIIDRDKSRQRTRNIVALLEKQNVPFRFSNREETDITCDGGNQQGIVAILKPDEHLKSRKLESILEGVSPPGLILVLDHVQDPHNLGACLRTAECAGVDVVILPRDGASPVNATVRKVASGATENINIVSVTNLAQTLKKFQQLGYWIIGTTDQGVISVYDCDFTGNIVVVMGSEGSGLRRLTMENCDYLARIPMSGSVSSLNISVATGVFLFEAARQRGMRV
jgi:23S rRNA (guanosine2251-2'-O)-methyltransferase